METCNECDDGTYQDKKGKEECELCMKGGYCPTNKKDEANGGFIKCLPGFYNPERKQFSSVACRRCDPGTFPNNDRDDCLECKPGGYCHDNIGSFIKCGKGEFNDLPKQTLPSACKKCDPGTYSDQEGSSSCKRCPKGTYSNQVGAEECTDCPVGLTTTVSGVQFVENCVRQKSTNLCSAPTSSVPNRPNIQPTRRMLARKPSRNRKPTVNRNSKPDDEFSLKSFAKDQLKSEVDRFRSLMMEQLLSKLTETILQLDENGMIDHVLNNTKSLFEGSLGDSLDGFFSYFDGKDEDRDIFGNYMNELISQQVGPLQSRINHECSGGGANPEASFTSTEFESETTDESTISSILDGLGKSFGNPIIDLNDQSNAQRKLAAEEESCYPKTTDSEFSIVAQVAGAIGFGKKFTGGKEFNIGPNLGLEAGLTFNRKDKPPSFRLNAFVGGEIGYDFSGSSTDEDSFKCLDTDLAFGLKFYLPGRSGDIDGWGGLDIGLQSNLLERFTGGCFDTITVSLGHNWYSCRTQDKGWRFINPFSYCELKLYPAAITLSGSVEFFSDPDSRNERCGLTQIFGNFKEWWSLERRELGRLSGVVSGFSVSPALALGLVNTDPSFSFEDNFCSRPYAGNLKDFKCPENTDPFKSTQWRFLVNRFEAEE